MLGTNDTDFRGVQKLRGERGTERLDISQAYRTGTKVSPKAIAVPRGLTYTRDDQPKIEVPGTVA